MSRPHRGIWKPKLNFMLCALVGKVTEAKLSNDAIEGRFGMIERKELPGLLENFLNWPDDPESILRFTRRYGPVVLQPAKTWRPQHSQHWSFTLGRWRTFQGYLRSFWKMEVDWWQKNPGIEANFPLQDGDVLEFVQAEGRGSDDHVLIEIGNLSRFLELCVVALPGARLRRCKRTSEDGCDTPYFVATHLKQDYCSDKCAHWAQKAVKRDWWNKRQLQLKKKGKGK